MVRFATPEAPCTHTIATSDSLHDVVNSGGVVCLEPGVHRLGGRPLQVTGPPTVWRSSDSSNPATISGGAQLLDWTACTDLTCPPGYRGAFTHSMEGIDAGMLPVRSLWVAGVRATRRTVAGAALNLSFPHGGFAFNGAAPGWLASAGADEVEIRWPSVIENWIEPRCVVSSVNVSARAMLLDAGCYANLEARIGKNQRPRPDGAFFENVAGPPRAGEFHATRSAVFYRPLGGTGLGGGTTAPPQDAWVPIQELLLDARGLHGHTFDNVGFEYSTARQPSAPGGYVEIQSAVLQNAPCPPHGCEPRGAVSVGASRNVSFLGCRFRHVGSMYALAIGGGSRGVVVRGCRFSDLSGGALKLASVGVDDGNARALSNDTAEWDTDYVVEENVVEGAALEWRGASAVFVGYVRRLSLQHNSISEVGYTGISLGWGWGRVLSFARDNHVRHNRLSKVMRALNDGNARRLEPRAEHASSERGPHMHTRACMCSRLGPRASPLI